MFFVAICNILMNFIFRNATKNTHSGELGLCSLFELCIDICLYVLTQRISGTMELSSYRAFGLSGLQCMADIRLMPIEQQSLFLCLFAFRATKMLTFCFQPCHSLFRSLTDKIALNLCRQTESEGKHFRLDVIAEAVPLFDSPHVAAAVHAKTKNLHNHIQVPTQPT